MSQLPGGLRAAASLIRRSASRSERAPIQFTSLLKLKAARTACRCESMRPGITVRPPSSTTRVAGPERRRISAVVPTPRILPSRTATASRSEDSASTVTTLPSSSTRSGGCAAAPSATANSATATGMLRRFIRFLR
jgi:hypothetical protein